MPKSFLGFPARRACHGWGLTPRERLERLILPLPSTTLPAAFRAFLFPLCWSVQPNQLRRWATQWHGASPGAA